MLQGKGGMDLTAPAAPSVWNRDERHRRVNLPVSSACAGAAFTTLAAGPMATSGAPADESFRLGALFFA